MTSWPRLFVTKSNQQKIEISIADHASKKLQIIDRSSVEHVDTPLTETVKQQGRGQCWKENKNKQQYVQQIFVLSTGYWWNKKVPGKWHS